MDAAATRDTAIATINAAIEEQGLAAEFSHKSIHRFMEWLRVQMPSVAQKYADKPSMIRAAIATNFSNLPDADASIMPVRSGQPFNTRRSRS